MEENVPLGSRVAITANDGTYLGLGTYICNLPSPDESHEQADILLDSGTSILLGTQCRWAPALSGRPMPTIEHTIHRTIAAPLWDPIQEVRTIRYIEEGTELQIKEFIILNTDEGLQVCTPVRIGGDELLLAVKDIDFPLYGE